MAKSFLMRDARGSVGGYLVCAKEMVYLKAAEGGDGCWLALLDAGGKVQRIRVHGDGQEHAYAYEGNVEKAVLLDNQGGMLLASEWEDASAVQWVKAGGKGVTNKASTGNEEKPESEREEGGPDCCGQVERREFPERRWPPPACMPGAYYQDGKWSEEQIHAEAQVREL